MDTRPLPHRAALFSMEAHARQVRKYTGEPYFKHAAEVAGLVVTVPHTDIMVAGAWLHDTVEDTAATSNDLRRIFGDAVASLVAEVTDISRPSDGNRAIRKAIDRNHLAKASPAGQTLKYADLISNTASIATHDPSFARTYLPEKADLLAVMRDGDPLLRALAVRTLHSALTRLGISLPAADALLLEV